MSEIKSKKNAMQEAYAALEALKKRVIALEGRRDEVQSSLPMLRSKIEEAEKRRQKAIVDHVSGAVSIDAVTAARLTVETCHGELEQANEILEAIQKENDKTSHLINIARSNCLKTRENYCYACAGPMEKEIGGNEKIRRLLLDAYAALSSSFDRSIGGFGAVDWGAMLSDIFSDPTPREIEEARARFKSGYLQNIDGLIE